MLTGRTEMRLSVKEMWFERSDEEEFSQDLHIITLNGKHKIYTNAYVKSQ